MRTFGPYISQSENNLSVLEYCFIQQETDDSFHLCTTPALKPSLYVRKPFPAKLVVLDTAGSFNNSPTTSPVVTNTPKANPSTPRSNANWLEATGVKFGQTDKPTVFGFVINDKQLVRIPLIKTKLGIFSYQTKPTIERLTLQELETNCDSLMATYTQQLSQLPSAPEKRFFTLISPLFSLKEMCKARYAAAIACILQGQSIVDFSSDEQKIIRELSDSLTTCTDSSFSNYLINENQLHLRTPKEIAIEKLGHCGNAGATIVNQIKRLEGWSHCHWFFRFYSHGSEAKVNAIIEAINSTELDSQEALQTELAKGKNSALFNALNHHRLWSFAWLFCQTEPFNTHTLNEVMRASAPSR